MNSPAGSELRTVRILISSPGDVLDERARARQIVESLRRRYARRFVLLPLLWEDLPLQPDMSFQQGIDLVLSGDGGVDIGVFILWSRLGSPVGSVIRKPDGSEYGSGTEREFELLIEARGQSSRDGATGPDDLRPHVLVYRRTDENGFHEGLRGQTTYKQHELISQKKLVEGFFAEKFKDTNTGVNLRAYLRYDRPSAFSQRLRTHLQELLDRMADGRPQETIWDTETQGPPFMGLEAFQQRHADVFFGREEEILEARCAIREQARGGCAFLLLCGPSGSGKSSLARAGVVPSIVENEIDDQVAAWRTAIVTPFELIPDPVASLVSRIASNDVLPELFGETPAADFVDVLRRNPEDACRLQLKAAFVRAGQRSKGSVRLLLVVDQLEELFTSAAITARDRAALLAVLEALARSGSVWVLATVRSDLYHQVQKEPALVRMKAGVGQLDVLPPGADALRRLVEEPAHHAGLRFERLADGQSLADLILRDAAAHPELLPLVEDLLRELYEKRADGQLTFAAYQELGNSVEGALALRAEKAFASLPADAQASLDLVLREMVTLGQITDDLHYAESAGEGADDDEHVVRRRASLSQFAAGSPARCLIDAFVAQRLFTTGKHPETGLASISVAHESLLRVWPRAATWAKNNRDFLSTRAHVARRMEEGSPLLEGDPLFNAARDHFARNPAGFREEMRVFITASVKAVEDAHARAAAALARRRKQVFAATTVALLAVLSSIFGSALYSSNQRARDARAAQLVSEAERNLSQRDYARAEIAAAAALTHKDTPAMRELLLNARSGSVSLVSTSMEDAPRSTLTFFNRDGDLAATVLSDEPDGRVVVAVISTKSHSELWRLELPAGASVPDTVAFSATRGNSRTVAITWGASVAPERAASTSAAGSAKKTYHVGVWNLDDGKPAGRFVALSGAGENNGEHTKRVPALSFHPARPWIATCGEDRKVYLWDYSHEQPRLLWEKLKAHGTAVHGMTFNEDGTFLATCGGDYTTRIWKTDAVVAQFQAGETSDPEIEMHGHADSVFALAFSPDGQFLASGGYDRIIRIWKLGLKDTESGEPVSTSTLSGHEGTVLALAFSDDSKLLTSGGKDGMVRLWDVGEGRVLQTIAPGAGEIRSVASRAFEDDLRVGGERGWSIWSVRGRSVAKRFWNGGATVNAVAFDPTGQFIAAGGTDGKLRLWDRRSSGKPRVLNPSGSDPTVDETINGIAFSADGRWVAAGGLTGVVHVWDREKDWTLVTPTDARALRHDGEIWGLCFDPQGRWLASGNTDENKSIRLWRVGDWSLLRQVEKLEFSIWALACDDTGQRLISGDSEARVIVWRTDNLERVTDLQNVTEGEQNIWGLAVAQSPFSILSANSDGYVRRWAPNDPEWIGAAKEMLVKTSAEDATVNPTVNSVSFSRKHGWVAAGGDGSSVEVYDGDLRRIRSLRGHAGTVWYVAFDPEGSHLAYGGTDRILRVFNLDEMDESLKRQTPDQIYRDSQSETGLSVEDGRITHGRPRR